MPLQQFNGEQIRFIGTPGAPILGHGDCVPAVRIRRIAPNARGLLPYRCSRSTVKKCVPSGHQARRYLGMAIEFQRLRYGAMRCAYCALRGLEFR
jgi:hypothetical protein